MKHVVVFLSVYAGLVGCASTHVPEYQHPDTPAKSTWSHPPASVSASEAISPQWWSQFGDPYLDSLVSKAIAGNVDLKGLAARITVANAQIAEAHAGSLPQVDVASGSSFQKSNGAPLSKQFAVGTQVSWDLDVWGKTKKGVQGQEAEFHATEADWRAGYLQIVADVSTTYFLILQLDEQIDQQQLAVKKNEQILAIYETLRSNGLTSDTEVLRQRAENNRLTKDLVELRRSRDVAENALATLVGVPAGEFKVHPDRLQDRVQVPAVPAGLPLELLARRPDVVAAEFRVLEAHDLMGQARLAQLPSVSLSGQAGTASLSIGDLFKTFTFGLMPTINLPIFNPAIKAHAKTTDAQVKVAEQDYEHTVFAAYEEVEDALVNIEAHQRQKEELQKQVEQLTRVSAQTQAQLEVGVVSQLDVFENERSLLSAQDALLVSYQQVLSDTVTLYKALGGGWGGVEVANAK
jgi:NodT family efflux transporter outer membrane factor (OMF) lipoprotein